MTRLPTLRFALSLALLAAGSAAADLAFTLTDVPWQQVAASNTFTVCLEREESDPELDRVTRMVFAVQTGKNGPTLDSLSVHWTLRAGDRLVGAHSAPIPLGMLDAGFSVAGLAPGHYAVDAELRQGDTRLGQAAAFFRVVKRTPRPPTRGRIPILLPAGMPIRTGAFPVSGGVPFPRGALWNTDSLRLVAADGAPVPAQFQVRSRWGHTDATSIRWLGLDFQAGPAPAWWPARQQAAYFLEYGPRIKPAPVKTGLTIRETADGLEVDTGPLQFAVRRAGFNLLDTVRLHGRDMLAPDPGAGLYLVDHEGARYRAANDKATTLTVEEQGPCAP